MLNISTPYQQADTALYINENQQYDSRNSSVEYREPYVDQTRLDFYRRDSCSSQESGSLYEENEEDSLERWPWIQEVREDGTLFYLESYVLRHNENHGVDTHDGKEQRGPSVKRLRLGKLKQALKRNRSLKKDKNNGNGEIKKPQQITSNNNVPSNVSSSISTDLSKLKLSRAISNPLIDVILKVTSNSSSNGSMSLLEDLLGIIAGLDLDPVAGMRSNVMNETSGDEAGAIVIQGLLEGKPAASNSDIALGDILVAVAGVEVNTQNVTKVLSAIAESCEVSLTIEKRPVVICPGQGQSKLFDLVAGSIEDDTTLIAHQEACALMYLTLDCNDDPDDDIIYWYPKTVNASKLQKIRGMFLTIGDLMDKVSSANATSSCLIMDGETLCIGYLIINGDILALVVPEAKMNAHQLEQQMKELERLLLYVFGTIEDAFSDVNRMGLNHLIALCIERILLGLPVKTQGTPSNMVASSLNGSARCLHLPAQNHVHISSILSDAEAADYGECIDDFFPHRRLYSTLGTCLFYKGHLVCNHLPKDDLRDCLIYCKNHCIFALTEQHRVNQMVVWKEVFPSRRNPSYLNPPEKDCLRIEEPDGRYFLLVVGLKHSVLCMLLEAGGVASTPEGSPGPHPYYVDTALSIVAYVQETLDFETICEARLRGPAIPALYSPSDAGSPKHASATVIGYDISGSKKQGYRPDSRLSGDANRSSVRGGDESPMMNGSFMSSRSRKSSHDSDTSRSSSSLGSADPRRSLPTSSSSDHALAPRTTLSRKSTAVGVVGDFASLISTKLTEGPQNCLFYYASLHPSKGIVICPTTPVSNDPTNQEILRNFYKACTSIHSQFIRQIDRLKTTKERLKGIPKLLESGLLFTISPKRKEKEIDTKKYRHIMRYWVLGRRIASSEFYICYENGIPQNSIELAFKLGFGSAF